MKTTILSGTPARIKRKDSGILPDVLINLFLVVNYAISIISFTSIPIHGHGGGPGVPQLPSFLFLFLILIGIHLVLIFRFYLSGRIQGILGSLLIISGAMILGLLLFSRQNPDFVQKIFPIPLLGYGSLILSLLLGLHLIMKKGIPGQWKDVTSPPDIHAFPLPEGRYRNVRIINEGGVGTIWYAERITDNCPVAVKVPKGADELTGKSFMQEISLWRDLDHPNIVSILSANILPAPYIEMEYLPDSLAATEKPVSITRAMELFNDLVSALSYAHSRGITHCDIKPTNILLTREGIPKLTDWGLSRSGSSRHWEVPGFSPRYAAPEQHQKPPGCSYATDIWQVGMILAELLTGRTEIPGGSERVFLQPEGARILPIILRCLATSPRERYRSAQDLRDELDRLGPFV